MTEIKTLRNYAFRWILVALLSVMFIVLLGGYRWHIHTTDSKLKDWTAPLENITATLLSQSGSSDDSLVRSTIAEREGLISGLNLTPSVNHEIRRYISNLYTVAGAFDPAKNSLPQTNDREHLFTIGTINLLQTNSLFSGDVIALYSGRQTIREAISFLSGSIHSTFSATKKSMSEHNLSVALASQIGVEVLLCTKSYDALAESRKNIGSLYSGLILSYQDQMAALASLSGNAELQQCISTYRQQLTTNISTIAAAHETIEKMTAISASRQRTYALQPLQCPVGIDLYQDILNVRSYEADLTLLSMNNSFLANIFATGNLSEITQACQSATSESGSGTNLQQLLSELTGSNQTFQSGSTSTSNSGSYIELPEDTQKIISDIYKKNVQYINTMQQSQINHNYNPLQRLQQLFKEFYGDTKEFIK